MLILLPEQNYLKHAFDKMKASNVPNVVTENSLDKLDCKCSIPF